MTDYHAEQREKKRHRAQHGMRVTGRSTKTVLHPLAHRNDYTPGPNEPTQWATLLGLTLSRRTAARCLDAAGSPVGWQHRLVGQSIATGTFLERMMLNAGVDKLSVEGAANLPYAIPAVHVNLHSPKVGVPVLWWRSVGSSQNAFTTESFMDELALAAGKDPVEYRRGLLAKHPRHLGVLELAAKQAGWGSPLAAGKPGEKSGRGIAVHESFRSFVAQVAEVTVKADNTFTVDRVVCAIDCGVAVNPDNVRAQMEGFFKVMLFSSI